MNFIDNIKVTIGDLNYGNHLDHARLITILHETRTRFLNSINLSEQIDKQTALVVHSLNVRYKNSTLWGDNLVISLNVRLENLLIHFDYSILNQTKNNDCAIATITMVPINIIKNTLSKRHQIYTTLQNL